MPILTIHMCGHVYVSICACVCVHIAKVLIKEISKFTLKLGDW